MRARSQAVIDGDPNVVWAVLADLGTWPSWLDVVLRAVPDAGAPGGEPAWRTRLGLRLGPVRPGFDVRMVRVVADEGRRVRFERRELDDRDDHSAVEIDVTLTPESGHVRADLEVLVEKRLPLVDLQRELDRRAPTAVSRLQRLVSGDAGAP